MNTVSTRILTVVLLVCGLSAAQETAPSPATDAAPQTQRSPAPSQAVPSSPAPANAPARIAPGSVIPVQLTKSIDVKKMKTGDEVVAKVTGDLKAENGEVVVPKDTKVVGHVTEAQARSKEQKESQVGIAFDHAVMKNGEVALPMSVQAIISQSYLSGGNNSGGGEGAGQASSAPSAGGISSSTSNGRNGGTGTPQRTIPSSDAGAPADAQTGNAHQPITGNTQGVLGFPDLKLSATADTTQGSVVSSEKNNVKLDSGTMLLLRVNQ